MSDKWFRLVGAPLVALVMVGVSDGPGTYASPRLGTSFLVALTFTVTFWEGNRGIFMLMRRLFPRYDQTSRRLVLQTLTSIGFTLGVTVALKWLLAHSLGAVHPENELLPQFLINLVPTLFVTSLYESAYFFGEWKKNLQRSEALARAGIQSELEALQRQLDPHFLFNSLNTLSALIDDTNTGAQRYVEQLADVYRYVLLSCDRPTVSLQEELDFVEAYVALHKTRFRDDLQLEQHVSPAARRQGAVAPLSVQMLVENALKHNAISAQRPLHLHLRAEAGAAGFVSVANNVQPKSSLEKSTKLGLRNIQDRYRLLTERPVEVSQEAGLFTVRLPLLALNPK